ncbi:MAG: sugar phosphate isomerase/epimerase family protein [Rhodospirillales bacterium]|nr:sugar phosphate isomerase/epimerase family protein [Rhodospirillales bacterium]MDP6884287.1 sugar phosphate isomerase/epimerase family protein [Rhodospirillales bacterium]
MTKPRVFTCTWTVLSVMDEIEAARFTAREGFAGMEIQCNPLGLWPTTASRSTIDELIAIGDGEGIEYTFYPSGLLNPATELPEERARNREFLKRSVDLAQRLDSPMLCIHPGVAEELFSLERKGVPFESDRFDRRRLLADARRRAVEAIAEWAEAAAQADLIIPVENEGHVHHTVAPTAALVRQMVEATGRDNVKVNLDTGHSFINQGLEEEFTVLRDHIVHVHLNDGRKMGVSEHLSLGTGLADFSPMAEFMNTFGGALVLEIYAPDRPIEATLESRDFILGVAGK